jgi:hypothetical protein
MTLFEMRNLCKAKCGSKIIINDDQVTNFEAMILACLLEHIIHLFISL